MSDVKKKKAQIFIKVLQIHISRRRGHIQEMVPLLDEKLLLWKEFAIPMKRKELQL